MSESPAKKAAPVINTVTMQDGKIVEFVGKRKILKSSSITPEGEVIVRMDFSNGQFREFTLPAAMLNKFAAHGAEQKLGDATAGLEDVEDAILAVDELIDQLYNGDWSVRRESNGLAGTSVLVQAMVQVTGKPVEAIKAFLKTKTQAEKIALRNTERIKPVVAAIEAAKVSKDSKIDGDALLDAFPS